MAHIVILHKSFEKNLGSLDVRAQDSIGLVVKALEGDAFFEPDPNTYVFDRGEDEHGRPICICQHISEWGGWQIVWFYEYSQPSPYFSQEVESVVVMLVEQQFQPIPPRKDKKPK